MKILLIIYKNTILEKIICNSIQDKKAAMQQLNTAILNCLEIAITSFQYIDIKNIQVTAAEIFTADTLIPICITDKTELLYTQSTTVDVLDSYYYCHKYNKICDHVVECPTKDQCTSCEYMEIIINDMVLV